ncbi:unnamed protein product [Owenia fusiformis]|uniref:Uncharacterized protein n=1 Tax=Owenia fusiformis TaxID=6347 RepID=A0A8J1TV09_OWEFU|nr:unnamed protein product [Owenia fusiformis]
MEQILIALLAVCALNAVSSHRLCKFDSDCDNLGDLICMKSGCDHGVCGCSRGKAARFYGSEKNFLCVDIKKIGESCSTDGLGPLGVCGASNSYCNSETNRCDCNSGYVSVWGGERCANSNPEVGPSGTCSSSFDGGSCNNFGGSSTCQSGSSPYSSYGYGNGFLSMYPSCSCPQGYRTNLRNDVSLSLGFHGKKYPTCEPILHDELCIVDADCLSPTMVCRNNKCACDNTTHVPDYSKMNCGVAVGKDIDCGAVSDEVCDGSSGLVCLHGTGFCDINPNMTISKCRCGPTHTESGSSCTEIGTGGTCYGDMNCKAISKNAICVDGACQDGAMTVVFNMALLCLTLAVTLQM